MEHCFSAKKCGLIPSVVGGEIESVTGMEEGKTFNYKCTIPGVTPKPSTPIPCEAGKWKDAENTKCESKYFWENLCINR